MVTPSLWAIEGILCLPLSLLVWRTQHLLNSVHPSPIYRRVHHSPLPASIRVLLLLVLWVIASLVAACMFVAYSMSVPGWQTWWSVTTVRLALGAGTVITVSLVFGAASLGHLHCVRRWSGHECKSQHETGEDQRRQ